MKTYFIKLYVLIVSLSVMSCSDYLELDTPKDQIDLDMVFSDESMANASVASLYTLLREQGFFSGNRDGAGYMLGCLTDELDVTTNQATDYKLLYDGIVLADNSSIKNIWSSSYKQIYYANNIIEGLNASDSLTESVKNNLLGECLAIRAVIHFYLYQTYGEIPYITTTNYKVNSSVSRFDKSEIIQHIYEDLNKAAELLANQENSFQKLRVNENIAKAFLARVYLYEKNWLQAKAIAEEIISSGLYSLSDTELLFTKESSSAVWQLKPALEGNNTNEAKTYIFTSLPAPYAKLSMNLYNEIDHSDLRKEDWINGLSDKDFYPYKYKSKSSGGTTSEYSIILRLEELYFIASEANLMLGNLEQSRNLLQEILEKRNISLGNTLNYEQLFSLIRKHRRIEFFCEFGHRFYDLKRWDTWEELKEIKPHWKNYFRNWPIPENELSLNPNLLPQNTGY